MTDPQNFTAMGDLLKKVMENPELLSGAMSMASALASSGALNGLLGKKTEGRREVEEAPISPTPPVGLPGLSDLMNALTGGTPPKASDPQSERTDPSEQGETPAASPPTRIDGSHRVGHRERIALLEAMRPFISHEKKDRLELLIRLLGVMEIAEGMGLGR